MFTPHTDADREAMFQTIGIDRIEELFNDVPEEHRFPELNLPPSLTELDVFTELKDIAWANDSARELISFLGAGAYNHYTPAVVDAILRRGEFYTAYTPYQAEISQGRLEALLNFQTVVNIFLNLFSAQRLEVKLYRDSLGYL